HELAYGLIENASGNYVIAGYTISNDGDITQNNGNRDVWVFEISPTGDMIWQNSFGGSSDEGILSIQDTSDGGYLLAGYTASSDGDVSINTGIQAAWLIKINAIGNMVWEKTYGGSGVELFRTLNKHPNGGFIAAGVSTSSDGDVSVNNGSDDMWIVRIDETGEIIWEKSLGGSNIEELTSLIINSDESYMVSGYTNSTDGDITSNNGNYDAWLVKLAADPLSISNFEEVNTFVYPNPVVDYFTINAFDTIQSVIIYDVFGKEIRKQFPNKNIENIQVGHLPTGTYFVKIKTERGVQIHKLIKK
ncbi:MAG: T9SS type A sorting domain-containing protein, partial [Flavobacteriales bacterium]|nr:T9SS type A sorting domain-containing protein [Flavobacteriales bacterium]